MQNMLKVLLVMFMANSHLTHTSQHMLNVMSTTCDYDLNNLGLIIEYRVTRTHRNSTESSYHFAIEFFNLSRTLVLFIA